MGDGGWVERWWEGKGREGKGREGRGRGVCGRNSRYDGVCMCVRDARGNVVISHHITHASGQVWQPQWCVTHRPHPTPPRPHPTHLQLRAEEVAEACAPQPARELSPAPPTAALLAPASAACTCSGGGVRVRGLRRCGGGAWCVAQSKRIRGQQQQVMTHAWTACARQNTNACTCVSLDGGLLVQ